jgi:hypothetical protein
VGLHHITSILNEDVSQCAVFDSSSPQARLIGIEYVISENIFKNLSPDEQKYWHSHVYDVKSGISQMKGFDDFLRHF